MDSYAFVEEDKNQFFEYRRLDQCIDASEPGDVIFGEQSYFNDPKKDYRFFIHVPRDEIPFIFEPHRHQTNQRHLKNGLAWIHEIPRSNDPVMLYLDFDCELPKLPKDRNIKIKFLNKIVKDVQKEIIRYYNKITNQNKTSVLWQGENCTRPEKFSMHIKTKDIKFKNMCQCGIFIVHVLFNLIKKYKKKSSSLRSPEMNTIATGLFPDLSVYNDKHSLRTLFSGKPAFPKQVLLSMDKNIRKFDSYAFVQSIITLDPWEILQERKSLKRKRKHHHKENEEINDGEPKRKKIKLDYMNFLINLEPGVKNFTHSKAKREWESILIKNGFNKIREMVDIYCKPFNRERKYHQRKKKLNKKKYKSGMGYYSSSTSTIKTTHRFIREATPLLNQILKLSKEVYNNNNQTKPPTFKCSKITYCQNFIDFQLTGKYCFIKNANHHRNSGRHMRFCCKDDCLKLTCNWNDKCKRIIADKGPIIISNISSRFTTFYAVINKIKALCN